MKRRKKIKLGKIILKTILWGTFTLIMAGLGFFVYIYINAPKFKTDLLYKKESSNLYDKNGVLFASLGTEKRQIISYDEIPQVLIDAIIATEDSRFFQHNGFDILRFGQAVKGYLTGNDAGGASTLTMQVSKNTFTDTTTEGFAGIVRKFTDIYMAIFKIEKDYSKEEIMEFYVNAPYLGAGSYGVKMACETYFGKDIKDINLVEAAMIAGMFQAPGSYDPYVNSDKTNTRKNEVINLMLMHDYITEEEAKAAKSIDIDNIVEKKTENINPYQGFIDTVVQEIIDKTGNNPYEVSMDIYTTMDKTRQDAINKFYKTWKFKDKKVQVGIGVIDNSNGEIAAVGAGRNKTSEMSFNYATQIKRHPGSTAKPLFDYGPGIEYKNWSTYTPFKDAPVRYTNGGVMRNVDGAYQGWLTMEQCLVRSRNTCALQAFQKLSNSKINKFVTGLGITPEYLGNSTYINEAHSIGGFTGVSPVQLAGAYAAFGNGGYYTEPHSVRKIIYKDADDEIEEEFNYERKRAMKDSTAYMISYMLQKVTSSTIKVKGTQIATKTGTSSYDEKILKKLNLPSSTIQDAWTVTFTKDYSVAIWYGYDKLTKKTYNTSNHAWSERTKIQKAIVTKVFNKNSKFKKPSSVVQVGSYLYVKGTQPSKAQSAPSTTKKKAKSKSSSSSSSSGSSSNNSNNTSTENSTSSSIPTVLNP